jgi:hypothetical protein
MVSVAVDAILDTEGAVSVDVEEALDGSVVEKELSSNASDDVYDDDAEETLNVILSER